MRKIILSGGPHTGKTTLLNALRERLPDDTYFVPEPAEIIIAEQLKRQQDEPEYAGIFPTTQYSDFVGLVVAKSVELEAAIPATSRAAVLDRSLIDNIGYARLNKHDHLVPDLRRQATAARYTGAILCDFVGTYTQTDIRFETHAHAQAIHSHLLEAYDDAGIPVLHLPPVPVEDRLVLAQAFIENT